MKTLSEAEKKEWLHKKGNIRRAPHKFTNKILHWPFCDTCGLVLLRNQLTAQAVKKQCEWEDE